MKKMSMTEIHNLLSRGCYSADEILAQFVNYIEQVPQDERYQAVQALDDRVWPTLNCREQAVWLFVFSGLLCAV